MSENDSAACPSSELLQRFSLGDVDESNLVWIEKHLDGCESCVSELTRQEIESPIDSATTHRSFDTLSRHDLDEISRTLWSYETPAQIGKYPIRRQRAVGGMGIVYDAWHPGLMCEVVIKTIKPQRALRVDARTRMLEEQRAMGRIRHPAIVAVLDADTDGDIPFIVMEKVPGVTLTRWVRDRSRARSAAIEHRGIGWREACTIGKAIADGLDQLHGAGLIHRDVKPSNVMIDTLHSIKLLDLGLAMDAGESEAESDNESVGTPAYASPEQKSGMRVGFSTDLYGLGATLVFLLTGAPPTGESNRSLLVDGVGDKLPIDLRLLLQQLLDPDPLLRPRSAKATAERFESIKPRSYRSIFLALLIIFGLALGWALQRAAVSNSRSAEGERRATAAGSETGEQRTRIFSRASFKQAGPLPFGATMNVETFLPRPGVMNAKLSNDNQFLACLGVGGNLRVYDIASDPIRLVQLVRCFSTTDVNHPQIHWLENDRIIAVTAAAYDPLLFWDRETRQFRSEVECQSEIVASNANANGDQLAIAELHGRIAVYRVNGEMIWESMLPAGVVPVAIAWSWDASILLIATDSAELFICDHETAPTSVFDHDSVFSSIMATQNGQWILGDQNGSVHKLSQDYDVLKSYEVSNHSVQSLVGGGNEHRVIFAAEDVCELNLLTGSIVRQMDANSTHQPIHLQMTDTGLLLAGGDVSWYPFDQTLEKSTWLKCINRDIVDAEYDPGGRQVAFIYGNRVLLVNSSGQVVFERVFSDRILQELCWSPDGDSLAVVSGWGGAHLYLLRRSPSDADQLNLQHDVIAPKSVASVQWLNHSTLITAGEAGTVCVWDAETGQRLDTHDVGDFVRSLSVSDNGDRVAMGFHREGILVTDGQFAPLHREKQLFDGAEIRMVRLHPDGKRLAVLDETRHVMVFQFEDPQQPSHFHSRWSKPTSIQWIHADDALEVTPLGVFEVDPIGVLKQRSKLLRNRCVDWSSDGSRRISADQRSALHYYESGKHRWSVLIDQDDTAVTVDSQGQVLWQRGTPRELIR